MTRLRFLVLPLLLGLGLIACGPAPARAPHATLAPEEVRLPPPTLAPVRLPRDDAPHDVLTEWWYYTGHLRSGSPDAGHRYGFEFVIFQSIRGQNPVGYLHHFAITDLQRQRFRYQARGAQLRAIPETLDLEVDGARLRGGGGNDWLAAEMDEYAIELDLTSLKQPALHLGGLVSFGPVGDSYYYSRTRMAASGRLRDGSVWRPVEGQAWHDHQWGNFVVPAVGGWDWFSVQLNEGTEVMLSLLRDPQAARAGVFGSFVDRSGRVIDLLEGDVAVETLGNWTSPHSGAGYPSGWSLRLSGRPARGLPEVQLRLIPLLKDQELALERMPYWEGAVSASGSSGGQAVEGLGYAELTGYR